MLPSWDAIATASTAFVSVAIDREGLRRKLRAALAADELPGAPTTRTVARPASGEGCSLCTTTIPTGTVAFELARASGTAVRLHAGCYSVWLEECVAPVLRTP